MSVAVPQALRWRHARNQNLWNLHIFLSAWQKEPGKDIHCPTCLWGQKQGVEKEKKEEKKMQQAETLKMSYYVWSLNPLSPANTFLWLVSKSDKACVCSQLIDRTVLIKQYPSLGKESPQSHFTFSSLYCTKVFFAGWIHFPWIFWECSSYIIA